MKRDPISLPLNLGNELVVDNFAGGGGASTGLERAFGRPVDVAINHDAEALAMHGANHPRTTHYCESAFDVDPLAITGNQPVGLVWLSPDCKHFSKAKGGKPVSKKIRGLAWIAIRWCLRSAPRAFMLENVEEFLTWCDLVEKAPGLWVPNPATKGETFNAFLGMLTTGIRADHPALREACEVLDMDIDGADAKRLVNGLGYNVEYRVLRACDYGTPTIRKRLFMVGRRDHLPIVWPKSTHGDPKSAAVRAGKLRPWRTAAECIDWSVPCPSIFERKRPLKDATLRRIAKGIMKFVVNRADPFIVKFQENSIGQPADEPLHTVMAGAPRFGVIEPFLVSVANSTTTGRGPNVWPLEEPVRTVTSSNDKYVVAPTLMHVTHQGDDRAADIAAPLATVTGAHRGEQALVTAHITKMRTGSVGSDFADPLHTVTAGGEQARPGTGNAMGIVSATLIQTGYGERPPRWRCVSCEAVFDRADLPTCGCTNCGSADDPELIAGQEPRVPGLDKPLGTAVAGGVKHAVVSAFLAKHYGGVVGTGVDVPTGTVTISDHHSVVTAQLVGCGGRAGQSRPRDAGEPCATITSKADTAVVTSHLLKLRNNQFGQDARDPVPTLTAGGGHVGEVRAFLIKYYGNDKGGQRLDAPLGTIPTHDRFGLVTIHGEDYVIVDIGMRMLTPRELARAPRASPTATCSTRSTTANRYQRARRFA